jgi:hypothetical protein
VLKLKVTSAPWASVSEVRVIVNGETKTFPAQQQGLDPFGTAVQVAYDGEIPLSMLLKDVTGDAWIVVEASRPLPLTGDLGGGLDKAQDGMPDTTDNNGDGRVDKADVAEGADIGPLSNGPFPLETDPGFHFANLTDNGFPFAFTNPFLLDRDGDGKFVGPGVKERRSRSDRPRGAGGADAGRRGGPGARPRSGCCAGGCTRHRRDDGGADHRRGEGRAAARACAPGVLAVEGARADGGPRLPGLRRGRLRGRAPRVPAVGGSTRRTSTATSAFRGSSTARGR